eukprot:4830-Heterococcus_DN1.PRE.2
MQRPCHDNGYVQTEPTNSGEEQQERAAVAGVEERMSVSRTILRNCKRNWKMVVVPKTAIMACSKLSSPEQ